MKSRDEVRLLRGLTTWKMSWLLILLGLGVLVGDVLAQSGDEKTAALPETVVSNYVADTEVSGAVLAKPVTRASREPDSLTASNSLAKLDSGHKNSRAVAQEIRVVNEWGVADYGLQKVYFPADLTAAPLNIVTPDGRRLKVRATFLALHDAVSGQSVLLGEVRPTEGEVLGANTVLYPNAFHAIHADVRYRYTKYSLEQDIILHESVKLPEGFAAEHTRLEVWSEWLDSVPDEKETVALDLRPEAVANHQAELTAVDEQLRFGAARIGAGHAFGLQQEDDKTPVAKTFDRVEGRDWLIERVDYLAVQPRLDQLPQRQAALPSKQIQFDLAELVRSLQARLEAPPQPSRTMRLAQATPPTQDSLVLDFIIVSSVPMPPDVISWWPGAGNAADVYGINSGTAYGGMTYGPGKVGQGFVFDAVNDHIRVPHHSSFELTWALTIEAWIRPTNVSGYRSIFSKWDAVGGVNQRSYEVSLYPGGRCYLLVSPVGTDSGATFVLSSNAVPLNEWTHIAAVADGSTLKVYLNGLLDAEGEYYAGIYPGTNAAGIGGVVGGATPGNSISRFAGRIDEPAIYGRALGAAEILAIYEAGIAGKVHPETATLPADLVAWWPGDDHAQDLAGTNHATVSGATYAAGYVSQSFSFDGTNDGVNAADDNALNLGSTNDQLTIETWIKAQENDVVMSIAGKRHTPDSSTATGYELFLIYGSPGIQLATPERAENYIDWGSDLLDGGWHHLAVTVDRSVTNGGTLYVNGTPTLYFDAAEVSGSLSNAAPFRIGVHPETGFSGWFQGMIDEPTVYRRALSGAEITALYVAGSAGKSKLDVDDDGLPDWWEWLHFGELSQGPEDDYDGDDSSNEIEYAAGSDPNTIAFQARFDNLYVSNRAVQGVCEVTLGQPYEMAVLTNTTELAGAVWTNYQPNFTVTLPDEDGDHLVLVALRGRVATNPPVMDFTELTLDRVAPVLAITNPILVSATATVIKPYLQLQGYANERLASLSYDITNEFGLLTNELVAVLDQYFDTNKFDFTTNWFQGYDIALATNENVITLRVADLAGNVTMTNFTVTLDYTLATNAPEVQLLWPTNDMHLSGDSFYIRGSINDETASIAAEWVDANDVTNTVVGMVERNGVFWVEDLSLAAGTNEVRLIATNAAGRVTVTNVSVVRSEVVITITSTPTGEMLYEPYGLVSGTISDPDYVVTVNGVQAVVNDTYANGDGSYNWTAGQVPNYGQGTATYDVVAEPSGGGGGGSGGSGGAPLGVSTQKERDAMVVVTYHKADKKDTSPGSSYTRDKIYTADWQADEAGNWMARKNGKATDMRTDGGSWDQVIYEWTATNRVAQHSSSANLPWDEPNFADAHEEHTCVPDKSVSVTGSVGSGGSSSYPPVFVTHYYAKSVEHRWSYPDGSGARSSVTAATQMKLYPGGKASVGRQSLICLTVGAEENGTPTGFAWHNTSFTNIPASAIQVLGKQVGSDGKLWVALPDNTPRDLNLFIKGKDHYNAWAWPEKHVPYITANEVRLDPSEITSTNCVGQKLVFKLAFDPALPEEIQSATYQWVLSGKYVNAWEEYTGMAFNNYRMTTCHPPTNWVSRSNFDAVPAEPYCKRYQIAAWPLKQSETGAWWVSGGRKSAGCSVDLTFANGQKATVSAVGKFQMHRPTVSMMSFTAEESYRQFFTTSYGLACKLKYGTDDEMAYGQMQYRVKVISDFDGDAGITQICDLDYSNPAMQRNGNLDGSTEFYDGTRGIFRSGNTIPIANIVPFFDTPYNIWVSANRLKGSFRDYVRFSPSGINNIPVTLGIVTWEMHAVAERIEFSGTWELATDSHPAPVGPDSSDAFPEWTEVIAE